MYFTIHIIFIIKFVAVREKNEMFNVCTSNCGSLIHRTLYFMKEHIVYSDLVGLSILCTMRFTAYFVVVIRQEFIVMFHFIILYNSIYLNIIHM